MKNKILIVDGSNLLFQMFFGMPARIYNENGIGIWGVLGFVGALLKMIRKTQPTHVVVLFDGESKNERRDLDNDYKANRVDFREVAEEENPFSQLPYIYQALDFLGIVHAETMDCETDDWIASYVYRYAASQKENKKWMVQSQAEKETLNEIIIASFDSDFFQLLSKNVSILRYRGDHSTICTPEFLWEKFGVQPEQYADFKSLTGDKADNIVGAYKVGPKTASVLLQEFGTLENILENTGRIKKNAVRESIEKSWERLRLNQKLIQLDGTHEVPFTLEEMHYHYGGITTTEVLRGIGLK